MLEYEHEMVEWSALAAKLSERAANGWRLVAAVNHGNQVDGEAPVMILFWEREGV